MYEEGMNTTILVTGASRRATLTIIRSLGRKGLKVCAGDFSTAGTASLSKYCSETFIYPNPQTDPKGYFDSIMKKIETGDYDVLLPVHDFELFPLLLKKNEVEKYTNLPFVDFDTFMKTINKKETIEIATKIGIKVPATKVLENVENLEIISNRLNYPLVIKPISQTLWSLDKGGTTRYITKNNYVQNKKALLRFFKEDKNQYDYLLQQYVKGVGAGTAFLFHKGQMRANFAYKRVREYPITGGPSTLRVSIKHDEMIEAGKRLLKELNWHGVAMVEFKLDESNQPILMEINGRFWGSLALPYHCDVDFPYMLYKMAVDDDVDMQTDYKTGELCRWLIPGDMLNFYFELKANRNGNLPIFKDFFKFQGMHYDYLDIDDPLPIIGAFLTSAKYFKNYLTGKRTISGEYR